MPLILKQFRSQLAPAVLLLLLWYGLSGGEGWLFAIPAIIATLLLSRVLLADSHHRLSLPGLLRFMLFFLHKSVVGGLDVAWRALSPSLPLDILEIDYRFSTQDPAAITVFIGTLSLMPGTLSVKLSDGVLTVHSIAGDIRPELTLLEARAVGLFQALGRDMQT